MSLRVLAVASECVPFVKTGGLADVVGGLPPALGRLGVLVTTLLPGYPAVLAGLSLDSSPVAVWPDHFGGPAQVLAGTAEGAAFLAIDAPHLYDRPGGPYTGPGGADWPDNPQRFAALAFAAAELARSGGYDALHAHDWQAGLAPAYLALQGEPRPKTVFTVHNFAFQGQCPASLLAELRLPEAGFTAEGFEHFGQIGFLKAGLVYADRITTVSPGYAREMLTLEHGMGLDGLLRHRAAAFSGIVNGIDDALWNPAADRHIAAQYDVTRLDDKPRNRTALRGRLGLADSAGPLFAVVSRLSWQKGLDLMADCVPALVAEGAQLAMLGSGDADLERRYAGLAEAHPGAVACAFGYDEALAHQMQAGADAFIVPSRFEPCGLTQLYAMRYGTVPVVARVGGLADTVRDDGGMAGDTGFAFAPVTAPALGEALARATAEFGRPWAWRARQIAGMAQELGWAARAPAFASLFADVVRSGVAATAEAAMIRMQAGVGAGTGMGTPQATAAQIGNVLMTGETTMLRVATTPIAGQRPGTSGLRKKTAEFAAPHFIENFIASLFAAVPGAAGGTFVVGGDGRYLSGRAVEIIIRVAAATGVARLIVGAGGLLSTPAASHLIRLNGATGGIVLSASHNPGGPEGDFGIKYNSGNGGPASEAVTEAIYAETQRIMEYRLAEGELPDFAAPGQSMFAGMRVDVVDPVADYAQLMAQLFDYRTIEAMVAGGFRMRFDAMHAVTGPYARAILEGELGFPPGTVMNGTPLPDFGGGHPDPNIVYAADLYRELMEEDGPDFGAASDGDGDRNLIMGHGVYVTPSDSLAILAANAHLVPGYAKGLAGVARSMPTSGAVDRVAAALGIPVFETPTGWKYFGNLLDAGQITLCGEESAGTGSDHVREKDGLWAVLLWLNILAVRRQPVAEIVAGHWARFGRNIYARHDYEEVDAAAAAGLMEHLRARLAALPGTALGNQTIEFADDFSYHDPVDGNVTQAQGVRIGFAGGSRIVFRLSGTGTAGATLRVYLERYEPNPDKHGVSANEALAELAEIAVELAEISQRTGRNAPDVVT